jgi:hypothetical protein
LNEKSLLHLLSGSQTSFHKKRERERERAAGETANPSLRIKSIVTLQSRSQVSLDGFDEIRIALIEVRENVDDI